MSNSDRHSDLEERLNVLESRLFDLTLALLRGETIVIGSLIAVIAALLGIIGVLLK